MIVIAEDHQTLLDPNTGSSIETIGPKDVVVLSPLIADTVVTRIPILPDDEVNELLRYQLDRHFPRGGKEMTYDHLVLGQSGDERIVAVVGIHTDHLTALRQRVNGARFTIPLGLFAGGKQSSQPRLRDNEVVFVVGQGWMTCFGRRGEEVFLRSSSRGDVLGFDIKKTCLGSHKAHGSDAGMSVALVAASDDEDALRHAVIEDFPADTVRFIKIESLAPRLAVTLFSRNKNRRTAAWRRSRPLRLVVLVGIVIAGLIFSYTRETARSRTYLDELRAAVAEAQERSLETLAQRQEAVQLEEAVTALGERAPIDMYQLIGTFLVSLGTEVRIDALSVSGEHIEASVRSDAPFVVARRVQTSGFFEEVAVSQVVALSEGEYRFSITGDLRHGDAD